VCQSTFNRCAARTASHSRGATTATKSFSRTTCTLGIPLIELSSTPRTLHAACGGRMTRACSMPFTRTSVTKSPVPNTFQATSRRGNGLPTTLYSAGGLGFAGTAMSMPLPVWPFHFTAWLKYFPPTSSP